MAIGREAKGLLDTSLPLWAALHTVMSKAAGPFHFLFLYPLLPWVGVMLLGFGASVLFERAPAARDRALLGWGLGITAAFLVLRFVDVYGDPNHWQLQARGAGTLIDFLNTTKYPPSLEFLAMTLGPAAIFCAYAERMRGFFKEMFVTFGRVPFAFYVAHFYLLHALSVLLGVMQGFEARPAHDLSAVLSAGIRRVAAGRVRGVGRGHPAAVSVLPLDGRSQGAQPLLVAELRLIDPRRNLSSSPDTGKLNFFR